MYAGNEDYAGDGNEGDLPAGHPAGDHRVEMAGQRWVLGPAGQGRFFAQRIQFDAFSQYRGDVFATTTTTTIRQASDARSNTRTGPIPRFR